MELPLERIAILDFGSQYSQLIARRVRENGVYSVIVRHDISPDELAKLSPRGIILSGGPASVCDAGSPKCDASILTRLTAESAEHAESKTDIDQMTPSAVSASSAVNPGGPASVCDAGSPKCDASILTRLTAESADSAERKKSEIRNPKSSAVSASSALNQD